MLYMKQKRLSLVSFQEQMIVLGIRAYSKYKMEENFQFL